MTYKLIREFSPRYFLPWLDRVQASPIGSRLARGVFWSVAGAVFSRGVALVAAVVTARLLGKQIFGEFGMIQSTMLMFGCLATVGLTATKYVAEYRAQDPARAGRVIGLSSLIAWSMGTVTALGVAAIAPWLATHTLAAPHLTPQLRLGAVCLLFTVISETQLGALSGFEAFKERSTIQFTVALISLPLTVVGVYWWGLTGAVGSQAVSLLVLVLLNSREINRQARKWIMDINWRGAWQEMGVFWSFSIPTLLGGILNVPVVWLGNTIIVNTPNGYSEMGIFSAADRWRTAIMFLPTLLGGVALPMLTNIRRESFQKYQSVLWLNVKISTAAAFSVAAPVALLSPWMMAAYGKEFGAGQWSLVILCISCVSASADWIIGQSLFSRGRVWFKFSMNVLWGATFLAIVWALRQKGALALAAAYLSADTMRLACVLTLMNYPRTAKWAVA
jgi:O-antigen/teichoic acid export membrane protein